MASGSTGVKHGLKRDGEVQAYRQAQHILTIIFGGVETTRRVGPIPHHGIGQPEREIRIRRSSGQTDQGLGSINFSGRRPQLGSPRSHLLQAQMW